MFMLLESHHWESIVVALPAVDKGFKGKFLKVRCNKGSNSSIWVPLIQDPETNLPGCSMLGEHVAAGPESVPLLLQLEGGF